MEGPSHGAKLAPKNRGQDPALHCFAPARKGALMFVAIIGLVLVAIGNVNPV